MTSTCAPPISALPWRVLSLVVGAVFATAAATKSIDPVLSVEAVAGFHMLPPTMAVALGLVLPGLEAAVGAALLVGYRTHLAACAGVLLSMMFAVAVTTALARSLHVECGCLGPLTPLGTATPALAALDVGLVVACAALAHRFRPRSGTTV